MKEKKILKWIEKNYKKNTNKTTVPRYEIVRVDGTCPLYNDKHFKLKCNTFCANRFLCQDCRYGDTKEQLIRKIAQVLLRETTNYFEFKIEDKVMKDIIKGERKLARKIVEFLGVEK